MKKETIVDIIGYLFIIVFVYTGVAKLTDIPNFERQLQDSPVLRDISWPVAIVVPLLEIGIAVLIAIPKAKLRGLFMATSLMIIFTLYIIIITQFASHIPCACSGVLQSMTWTQHFIFNIVFLILGIIAMTIHKLESRKTSGPMWSRT
ncbi:hypothetical protein KK062_27085 [Fulvivirgaceae bacterium PWU5]|uniref:Methylamine utilisation protein MauE domain-containing protein n=1 Tax=Dawidia cretensis TaxID=2782350 RepID=A0AAP2E546_9BACT|nr:MauE/DoxX family redox-associated membrane protein [Dawidia cretensis]MBT1711937.1 hypothetical protein [Dawidia cretensis]